MNKQPNVPAMGGEQLVQGYEGKDDLLQVLEEQAAEKLLGFIKKEFNEELDPEFVIYSAMRKLGFATHVRLERQEDVDRQIDRKFKNAELISSMIKNMDAAVEIMPGLVSDGYHTFNELYHHRAVLFMCIIKLVQNHFPNGCEKAWMSWKHHSGDMYDGMFIVGIDTPTGPATYHYNANPYWRLFQKIGVSEIESAPKWDGHTPGQALDRLAKMCGIEDILGYTIDPETEQE